MNIYIYNTICELKYIALNKELNQSTTGNNHKHGFQLNKLFEGLVFMCPVLDACFLLGHSYTNVEINQQRGVIHTQSYL